MRLSLQPALSASTKVGTKDRSTTFQANTKSFREGEQKIKAETDCEPRDRKQETHKEKAKEKKIRGKKNINKKTREGKQKEDEKKPAGQKVCMRIGLQPTLSASTTVDTEL